MSQHVQFSEFVKDSNRFLDAAKTSPVYLERSNGTTVLIAKADYERLVAKAGERRSVAKDFVTALREFGPVEDFPAIPRLPVEPLDL